MRVGSGIPVASGLLVTIKVSDFSGYSRQMLHAYDGDEVYYRRWDSVAGDWTPWKRIAGGATGSFTASSGETVTVENGLITSIA